MRNDIEKTFVNRTIITLKKRIGAWLDTLCAILSAKKILKQSMYVTNRKNKKNMKERAIRHKFIKRRVIVVSSGCEVAGICDPEGRQKLKV